MGLLTNIYNDKTKILTECNINDLTSIIQSEDTSSTVTNNYNRTISVVTHKDANSICKNSMSKWLKNLNLSCSLDFLYTMMPLYSGDSSCFILKI